MDRQQHDRKEARTGNSGFAKKRVQWLIEHSTSHQLLCYVDSFEFRNPLLRKAAKRYMIPYDVPKPTSNETLKDQCILGEALFAILRKSKIAASQVKGNAFAALLLLPNRMGKQFNFNHNYNSTVVFLKKEVNMK